MGEVINFSVIPNQMSITGLTFMNRTLEEVKIFGKLEPMINFYLQFDLPKIRVWDNYFPQY